MTNVVQLFPGRRRRIKSDHRHTYRLRFARQSVVANHTDPPESWEPVEVTVTARNSAEARECAYTDHGVDRSWLLVGSVRTCLHPTYIREETITLAMQALMERAEQLQAKGERMTDGSLWFAQSARYRAAFEEMARAGSE